MFMVWEEEPPLISLESSNKPKKEDLISMDTKEKTLEMSISLLIKSVTPKNYPISKI